MILSKIIKGVSSYIKLFFLKIIYFKNLKLNKFWPIFLGKGTDINLSNKGSQLIIEGNLVCRNNVNLKVTNGRLKIGNNVFFNNNTSVTCRKKIVIGDDCLFGESVKVYDHDHNFRKSKLIRTQGFTEKEVEIGNNVWIGSNSVILKGVNIGDNVVIASGTIINKDIPDNCIAYNQKSLNIKYIEYK
ncbi:acyltransferase [Sporohalobacter salinus]|uniref:acyltransferase n=1 Tax=Sporohalobacter salinus TaxID=1494606 RepID=UPI00195FA4E1|nr:acyltransferase [Sporohalobacter salinus]MBM7622983.1 acetyltransferase-like isoleucine patch superfamily enzyme [Sporohalobacter salinus]